MAKSIKKNFIYNIILTASSMIFPLITTPYVSKVLLPVGTGKVAFAISLISYFQLFAGLGIPTYGIRACAVCRDDKEKLTRTSHELLFVSLITSLISYIALAGCLFFIPQLREEKLLYVIISSTIFLSSIGMEWLFKGLEQYSYITIRSVIFKLIAFVLTLLLVKAESDYLIYGILSVLAASASNLLNLFTAHKYIGFKWMGGYDLKKHLKPILTFFALSCATTIYTHLDSTMLGFIVNDQAVGIYDVALKIKTPLTIIVTSLGAVLLPRVSYYVQHGDLDKFWEINKKALNFVFVIALPLAIYFTMYASQAVVFLSSNLYINATLPLQIILPTIIFIGITNLLGFQILVPLGKEKVVLLSCVTGAVVNLIFNSVLIPSFGETGAAIGTLVAEFTVLIYQLIALRKAFYGLFSGTQYYKIIPAVILAGASSFWVANLALSNFLTLLISAVIFFVVYFLILLVLRERFCYGILKQYFKKIKK